MTIQYLRTGKDDSVLLWYNFPDPSKSEGRFYQGASYYYPDKPASNSSPFTYVLDQASHDF